MSDKKTNRILEKTGRSASELGFFFFSYHRFKFITCSTTEYPSVIGFWWSPLKKEAGYMQQENDPKHDSNPTSQMAPKSVLDRSSQSPDLNLIEMLWQYLTQALWTTFSTWLEKSSKTITCYESAWNNKVQLCTISIFTNRIKLCVRCLSLLKAAT